MRTRQCTERQLGGQAGARGLCTPGPREDQYIRDPAPGLGRENGSAAMGTVSGGRWALICAKRSSPFRQLGEHAIRLELLEQALVLGVSAVAQVHRRGFAQRDGVLDVRQHAWRELLHVGSGQPRAG